MLILYVHVYTVHAGNNGKDVGHSNPESLLISSKETDPEDVG